jgi:hypothetical protein
VTKVRWALGLSGLLSIAFGVVILVWPGISLYALVILFGAYALVRGAVRLGTAFPDDRVVRARGGGRRRETAQAPRSGIHGSARASDRGNGNSLSLSLSVEDLAAHRSGQPPGAASRHGPDDGAAPERGRRVSLSAAWPEQRAVRTSIRSE